MPLFPKKRQWKRWTLPSKYSAYGFWVGAISLLIGMIGLLLSIGFYIFPTDPVTETATETIEEDRDWDSYAKTEIQKQIESALKGINMEEVAEAAKRFTIGKSTQEDDQVAAAYKQALIKGLGLNTVESRVTNYGMNIKDKSFTMGFGVEDLIPENIKNGKLSGVITITDHKGSKFGSGFQYNRRVGFLVLETAAVPNQSGIFVLNKNVAVSSRKELFDTLKKTVDVEARTEANRSHRESRQ